MDLGVFLDFAVTALDVVFAAFVAYGGYLALRYGEIRFPQAANEAARIPPAATVSSRSPTFIRQKVSPGDTSGRSPLYRPRGAFHGPDSCRSWSVLPGRPGGPEN